MREGGERLPPGVTFDPERDVAVLHGSRKEEPMGYDVKEIFYTLQGEGANTGKAAVFLRFSGCNLWNGREEDRHKAFCRFCDTDFVGIDGPGGGRFDDASSLASAVGACWGKTRTEGRFVV